MFFSIFLILIYRVFDEGARIEGKHEVETGSVRQK